MMCRMVMELNYIDILTCFIFICLLRRRNLCVFSVYYVSDVWIYISTNPLKWMENFCYTVWHADMCRLLTHMNVSLFTNLVKINCFVFLFHEKCRCRQMGIGSKSPLNFLSTLRVLKWTHSILFILSSSLGWEWGRLGCQLNNFHRLEFAC